jgi:hypothetical protein
VQSFPKIVSGPEKKKMVAARNKMKNIIIPIENNASKHPPPFPLLLEPPFIDPVSPATPNIKKMMEEI